MVIQTAPKKAAARKIKTVGLDSPEKFMERRRAAEAAVPKPIDDVEPKRRGRAPSGTKIYTLRLNPLAVEKLQAEGPGWGARANAILEKALGL